MYDSFLRPIEYFAATALDGVAEFLGYDGSDLKVPVEREVVLPDDLFARSDVQTEWWYYTGHCATESGLKFGFEFVIFKRRTDLDSLGIIPMALIANPMYAAHFAMSEISLKRFNYEHIRSFGGALDLPVSMSETSFDVRLGDWTMRGESGNHILHASLGSDMTFDATLETGKPLVLNGDGGNGISRKMSGASHHFSFTRMNVSGEIAKGGRIEKFTGTAWMDREFGMWEQTNWDWFSIQFDDETELMIYQFRTEDGLSNGDSTGTFVDRDGNCSYLKREDFNIETTSTWTSEKTGTEYPSGWRVAIPRLDLEIAIEPYLLDQELDTRGTTMVVYWEGACKVTGKCGGKTLTGRAYVELVGYDKSSKELDINTFLFADPLKRIVNWF